MEGALDGRGTAVRHGRTRLTRHLTFAVTFALALMLALQPDGTVSVAEAQSPAAELWLDVSPLAAPPGSQVSLSGRGAPPGAQVRVLAAPWGPETSCRAGRDASPVAEVTAGAGGEFSAVHVPARLEPDQSGFTYLAKVAVPPATPGGAGSELSSNVVCFQFGQPVATGSGIMVELPNGRFYTAANEQDGRGDTGFATLDQHWYAWGDPPPPHVRFFSEFLRLGGVTGVGYPASRPFEMDGFVVQTMQKGMFQWRPEAERVFFVNVFDLLHRQGLDDTLYVHEQIPRMADWSGDAGLSWSQVVARHMEMLRGYPRLQAQYDSAAHALDLYGLPMSPVVDFGPFYAVRLQRAVFQQYKVATPYARPGDVLVVNGGDLAKQYGLVPDWAAAPHEVPRWSESLLVSVPNPGDTVGPTFRVVGDARVFEAHFRWEVRAVDGRVLREGTGQASTCCAWARYLLDLNLGGLPAQPVQLVLLPTNPAGGAPTGVVAIPLLYVAG